MSKCKKCGAEIIWVQTATGKWMPCDEGLTGYWESGKRNANFVTDKGEVISRCSTGTGEPDGYARIPHWVTCPYADDFRR